MVARLAFLFAILASTAVQPQETKKPIPATAAKAEPPRRIEAPHASIQKAAETEKPSESPQTSTTQSANRWTDPITWFTFVLAVATALLWLSTRAAARAAKQSADAASANVTTLITSERAYVFSELVLEVFGNSLMDASNPLGKTRVRVKFWNYGKTPAVITMIRGYISLLPEAPQELLQFEGSERPLPPSLGIATNDAYDVVLEHDFGIDDFSEIKHWTKRLYAVGKIEYRTVHGKECVTGFCWHVLYRDEESTLTVTRESRLNIQT